jgi:hypothetical protein
MAEEDLVEVLGWLDPDQQPVLVQLPEPVFETVESAWGLP